MEKTPSVITVTLNPALDKTVTVDKLEPGGLNRIRTMRTDAGGKGINVAKVLKRFEVGASAWGLTAGGPGKALLEKLRAADIPFHFIETNGETRTNLKIVDESAGRTTELNEPGFVADGALLERFAEYFEANVGAAKVAVLGGSLPPGAPETYYERLIAAANARGVRVILDADGPALKAGLRAKPYALKPNLHELEQLFGERLLTIERVAEAAGSLIGETTKIVLVSMGGQGSLLVTEREAYRAVPFPIAVQSTVGAGDSMVGAMAYGFLKELTAEALARMTSAAGTVTASKPGTDVCDLQEVNARLDDVGVSKLIY